MENQINKSISISEIMSIVRRRKWLFLLCLIGTLAPVLLYNHKAIPIYRGATDVIFDESEKGMDLNFFGSMNKGNFIANQIEEMKTKSFAEEVYAALPDQVRKKFLSLSSFSEEYNIENFMVNKIKSNLSFTPIRGTEIIKILYDSENRELAQIIANTTATVMIKRNLTIRRQQYSNVKDFVEEQFEIVKNRLQEAENALKDFKEREGITSLEAESREILERSTQAEIVYNQVKTNKKELEERLVAIKTKLKEERKDLPQNMLKISSPFVIKLKERLVALEVNYSNFQVQGVPENNPKMRDLSNEIAQVKQNLVQETLKFNKDENIESLIDPFSQMKKFLEETITLEVDLQALEANERNLHQLLSNYNNMLKELPQKEMHLIRLMREQEVNSKTYMTLVEKREAARIQEASEIGNIRILEPARLPGVPISPRKFLNIFVGVFSGLFFGIFLIFLLEYFNDKIRTQDEIEKSLGLPVIAVIPKHNNKEIDELFNFDSNGKLYTNSFTESILYDAYNLLSFALDRKQGKLSTIMLTSATPDEGKSTIASILAMTSAQRGKKTLLIDADLRKPTLHSIFNVSREPGLTNLFIELKQKQLKYLSSNNYGTHQSIHSVEKVHAQEQLLNDHLINKAIMEGLTQTFQKNLLFIPCGFIPPNPVRIWSTDIWYNIFKHLNDIVDLIIIDAPPIIGVAETTMMAMYIDHILFCIAADTVEKKILKRVFDTFRESITNSEEKIVGAVLNKADMVNMYGSYKYYRYYSKKDNFRLTPELPSLDFTK